MFLMKGTIFLVGIALEVLTAIGEGRSADLEVCQPWVAKTSPAQVGEDVRAPSKAPPPRFIVKRGGIVEPTLVFLGDSLTQGAGVSDTTQTYPMQVIENIAQPERRYEIYAIGGQDSTTLSTLFGEHRIPAKAVLIIWLGRNNNLSKPEVVVADISQVLLQHPVSNFLVLSVLRGRYESEQPGGERYKQIAALNEKLKAEFSSNFVDVGTELNCSDRIDNVHLDSNGYKKIANIVADELRRRSW